MGATGATGVMDSGSYVKKFLTGIAAIVLSGCSVLIVPKIQDLKFEGVELVATDLKSSNEFDTQEHRDVMQKALDRKKVRLLKINFSTEVELGAFKVMHEVNVATETSICPIGEGIKLAGFSDIYFGNTNINSLFIGNNKYQTWRPQPAVNGLYMYHTYAFHKRSDFEVSVSPGELPLPPYDLAKESQDVCLKFRGGNMLGGRFTSNIIVVPRDEIRKALRPLEE